MKMMYKLKTLKCKQKTIQNLSKMNNKKKYISSHSKKVLKWKQKIKIKKKKKNKNNYKIHFSN